MGLEATFSLLVARLQAMQEVLTSLYTTVVEDRPLDGPPPPATPALVDILGSAVEDLIGWTMEATAEAQQAYAGIQTGDLELARRTLASCHRANSQILHGLVGDLLDYDRLADLAHVGRTRGREWHGWATMVKQAIDSCRQPLFDLQQAEIVCWQDLTEHGRRQSISVHATGIGQQGTQSEPQYSPS